MKLKIIFCEPPIKEIKTELSEKIVIIQSPYKVIQEKLGDTREYELAEDAKISEDFNYEQYCYEMRELIENSFYENDIFDNVYNEIIFEGFKDPSNFQAVCSKVQTLPITYASYSKILFENCSFGGKMYTDTVKKLVHILQKNHSQKYQEKLKFEINIIDKDQECFSKHDEARLALLENIVFRKENKIFAKYFKDDSLIGIKRTPLTLKLEAPTFFYRNDSNNISTQTTSEFRLKNFFSQEAQQQSDYTCGPAAVKMVAEYYNSMQDQNFCEFSVTNKKIWHKISHSPEMIFANQINTTEAEGSDISDIRNGLLDMNIIVFDDNGLSNKKYNAEELNSHKNFLLDKIQQILKLGIPIILNMQDRAGCGHFEVVIGIEKNEDNEHIILAEPGTALIGNLHFEYLLKNEFLARWKNTSGEYHGRFMILAPNEQSTLQIDDILAEVPHYKNGKNINRILEPILIIPEYFSTINNP